MNYMQQTNRLQATGIVKECHQFADRWKWNELKSPVWVEQGIVAEGTEVEDPKSRPTGSLSFSIDVYQPNEVEIF